MFLLLQKLFKGIKIYFLIEFLVVLTLFSLIFFFTCDDDDFSGLDKKEYKTDSNRFFTLFYYCFVTGSTIGYGDIYPKTFKSRSIAFLLIVIVLMIAFK